ncbi:MAG: hypothetical protein ACI8UO_004105 [Verrucomicrobiales bacterium]
MEKGLGCRFSRPNSSGFQDQKSQIDENEWWPYLTIRMSAFSFTLRQFKAEKQTEVERL